ncbi:hypothetical protein CVT26_009158 [Gymnopilus dilepis]|uniref:Uncharacterized protein n=1 Tax=Gymnopilus dilepis TaxID=231916 RepID=A0A409XC50_9AGAR|nr:hypothetical protein CVT26_009158 [Gymnopilus dilepis]
MVVVRGKGGMMETAGHEPFSLNLMPGAGLSDCECPERVWSPHNALSNSTKTQGPGSRHDILDDHFGFWNWLKYKNIGTTLVRKYKVAVAERNVQVEGHRGLSASLNQSVIQKWERMCLEWEQDLGFPKKKKNPYHVKDSHISEARVKKQLSNEEEARLKSGGIALNRTKIEEYHWIMMRCYRCRLKCLSKGVAAHATLTQEGNLTEQQNVLRARMRA